MRVKYKNLLTGNTNDKTFKSGESLEDVNHSEIISYHDNDHGILWTKYLIK